MAFHSKHLHLDVPTLPVLPTRIGLFLDASSTGVARRSHAATVGCIQTKEEVGLQVAPNPEYAPQTLHPELPRPWLASRM